MDVYFDNVGGEITDAAFNHLNEKARVAVCGQISEYNAEKPEFGPRLLRHLLTKRARAEGFLVSQFADRYPEGLAQMAEWLKAEAGAITNESTRKFFENFVTAFSAWIAKHVSN